MHLCFESVMANTKTGIQTSSLHRTFTSGPKEICTSPVLLMTTAFSRCGGEQVRLKDEAKCMQRSTDLWNLCVNKVVSNRNQSSPKRSGNIRTGEQSLSIFHCFNFSQFLDERKVNLDIRRQPKRRKYLSVAMISEIRDLTYLLLFAAEWQQ
ncbi:hypothetical protein AXG93_3612s1290 [Marchantia polymorpha subsp. ruderalis]|uniref:Uncharacterized protein n=1 Tax=Marchantia polymorpha subsp. ruderalis TaxID=1480154 RepID=A0A176WE46_MARPO|nr:hypothetical protein AXG93_3612s1290 [Marchantia polymorpha subsp. ruderalis]